MENKFSARFSALSQNEAFARVMVSGFLLSADPLVSEMTEIKTVVSEAVTNCIVHGYDGDDGYIDINCSLINDIISIEISDAGRGIADTNLALQPMYTTKPDGERMGMGFTIMQAFMDTVSVTSAVGRGTTVVMTKRLQGQDDE